MAKQRISPPEKLEFKTPDDRGYVTIERTFEVITPVFGGGAYISPDEDKRQIKDIDPITPIRTAGIRGQLRFWWRATSAYQSLEELKAAEDELWGTTSKTGLVSLKLVGEQPTCREIDVFEMKQSKSGRYNARSKERFSSIPYAAFPLQPKGGLFKQLVPGTLHLLTGSVDLHLEIPKEHKQEIQNAVDAWLLFGGIGGRTRRGLGALMCHNKHLKPEEFLSIISKSAQAIEGVPSLAGARLVLSSEKNDVAKSAYEKALGALQEFRQGLDFGRNRKPDGYPGRSRWPEAENIRDVCNQSHPDHKPKIVSVKAYPRAVFGLPIIFHFKDSSKRNGPNDDPADTTLLPEGKERRASPLILRPFFDGKSYRALALVLTEPGRKSESVVLKVNNSSFPARTQLKADEANWKNSPLKGQPDALQAFLDFFAKKLSNT